MEWIKSLLTSVTSGVSISHPLILIVIFALIALNEVGFPLFFALEIFQSINATDVCAGAESD